MSNETETIHHVEETPDGRTAPAWGAQAAPTWTAPSWTAPAWNETPEVAETEPATTSPESPAAWSAPSWTAPSWGEPAPAATAETVAPSWASGWNATEPAGDSTELLARTTPEPAHIDAGDDWGAPSDAPPAAAIATNAWSSEPADSPWSQPEAAPAQWTTSDNASSWAAEPSIASSDWSASTAPAVEPAPAAWTTPNEPSGWAAPTEAIAPGTPAWAAPATETWRAPEEQAVEAAPTAWTEPAEPAESTTWSAPEPAVDTPPTWTAAAAEPAVDTPPTWTAAIEPAVDTPPTWTWTPIETVTPEMPSWTAPAAGTAAASETAIDASATWTAIDPPVIEAPATGTAAIEPAVEAPASWAAATIASPEAQPQTSFDPQTPFHEVAARLAGEQGVEGVPMAETLPTFPVAEPIDLGPTRVTDADHLAESVDASESLDESMASPVVGKAAKTKAAKSKPAKVKPAKVKPAKVKPAKSKAAATGAGASTLSKIFAKKPENELGLRAASPMGTSKVLRIAAGASLLAGIGLFGYTVVAGKESSDPVVTEVPATLPVVTAPPTITIAPETAALDTVPLTADTLGPVETSPSGVDPLTPVDPAQNGASTVSTVVEGLSVDPLTGELVSSDAGVIAPVSDAATPSTAAMAPSTVPAGGDDLSFNSGGNFSG